MDVDSGITSHSSSYLRKKGVFYPLWSFIVSPEFRKKSLTLCTLMLSCTVKTNSLGYGLSDG